MCIWNGIGEGFLPLVYKKFGQSFSRFVTQFPIHREWREIRMNHLNTVQRRHDTFQSRHAWKTRKRCPARWRVRTPPASRISTKCQIFTRRFNLIRFRPSPPTSKLHTEDVKRAILNKFNKLKEVSSKPKVADIFRKRSRADGDKSSWDIMQLLSQYVSFAMRVDFACFSRLW